jgi:Trk K+ transport system NAD-binding subunit
MEQNDVNAAPLVDANDHYVGVVTLQSLQMKTGGKKNLDVEALVDSAFAPIHESVHLDVVLDTLTSTPQTWAAVIDDDRRVVGTIAISDIVRNYRRTMQANLRHVSELGGYSGISEISVASDSSLADVALRSGSIPRGVLITAIERGRDTIRPTGETIIKSGDRLIVLGNSDDLDVLRQLASFKK